jgi:hypothetical protein
MIEISLGRIVLPDKSNWLTRRRGVIVFMFGYMPWPKGKIKAPPEFFAANVGEFSAERDALIASIEEFLAAVTENPQRPGRSPLLGAPPLELWRLIHGRHLSHHLEQFGA